MKLNKYHTYILFSCVFCVLTFCLWSIYPILFGGKSYTPGRIFIRDRHWVTITDKARPDGYFIPLSVENRAQIKNNPLVRDLIQIEDQRFWDHAGLDIFWKVRAFRDNMRGNTQSGGSTITEQWIKNAYFPHTPRTYSQKIREAFLALIFSMMYSKEEILEKYLNSVYLGNGVYGVQSAIETFFGKNDIVWLSSDEITTLLALIHAPTDDTSDTYFLTYLAKIQKRLWHTETPPSETKKKVGKDMLPFVTNYAERLCRTGETEGLILFRTYDCERGIFESTIDKSLSDFARSRMQSQIELLRGKNVTNAGFIAMRPWTREVIVYEGSRNFYALGIDGQVDVLRAKNQVGSTMKPFVYLLALERGYSPDDLLVDLENTYPSFQPWFTSISENYTLKQYGLVRFKHALGNSLNNATIRLAQTLGLDEVYNFYRKKGFTLSESAEHYGYALVLGNPDITLIDLVKAYDLLVPTLQRGTIDTNLYLLYDILRDPDNRAISFGVNSLLGSSIPQAVKTWTSSNFRDNTLVSYSQSMIIGVWVGNNDNTPMIGVTGISGAGALWHQVAEEMIRLGYIQPDILPPPPDIREMSYCLDTSCFQKEIIWTRKDKEYYSRPTSKLYDRRDIPSLLPKEETRLNELGFQVR